MNNEEIARKHFESIQHDGPLVAAYRIDDDDYLTIARPGYGLGHRLSLVVPAEQVTEKVLDYVQSLAHNFTFNDLLIRDLEVFEGQVW